MKRQLVSFNDSILKQKCEETHYLNTEIGQDLEDTFVNGKLNGVGLAAPQIGLPYRSCVCLIDGVAEIMNNPVIEKIGEETFVNKERCLSFPNIVCTVRRASKIKVVYFDKKWHKCERILEGVQAEIVQHECDHLDGITMLSIALKKEFRK